MTCVQTHELHQDGVCVCACCCVVLQVMYLDQVVDRLLVGHTNSKQHKSLLQQHKTGGMTPTLQVGKP